MILIFWRNFQSKIKLGLVKMMNKKRAEKIQALKTLNQALK